MRLLSIRMRAELRGRHVSGAERIVRESELEDTIKELLKRPKVYDFLNISVEEVKEYEVVDCNLPVSSFFFKTVEEAREFAVDKLIESGIKESVARKAVNLLAKGANPKGGNMRGAVVMDVETGERLEPDMERGVRTVRFDWVDRRKVTKLLLEHGYTLRTVDALALACKNLHCGVVAELCWSDDPDYITGYVASNEVGYTRIAPLKEKGDPLGGRVYFVKKGDLERVIECLEGKSILIKMTDGDLFA
ncbi:6-carboxyhexanoate--CoA ligase [Aquifex sp.]